MLPTMNLLPHGAAVALLLFAISANAQNGGPKSVIPNLPEIKPASAAGEKGTRAESRPAKHAGESETAGSATRDMVDGLSQADLDRVLPLLKSRYASPDALSPVEIERATVEGLLKRLSPTVTLLSKPEEVPAKESPFKSEVIEGYIDYLRLGSINPAHLAELDAALKDLTEKKYGAVVLDLRATPAGTDFDLAAAVCQRFAPKGKVLFTVRRPNTPDQVVTAKDEPQFHGVLAVLTDEATAGNAEIIAGVLQALSGAMVIGKRTAGAAAEFAELPLSGTKVLRVAVAEVILPGATSPALSGLRPDLLVDAALTDTNKALAEELEKGVAPLVTETERLRMNEASLVAGVNPDLEALIAAGHTHADAKAPLRDVTLQRAVDFITSVSVYEKGVHPK